MGHLQSLFFLLLLSFSSHIARCGTKGPVVQVTLRSQTGSEAVWFHSWPGATPGKDSQVDIPRATYNPASSTLDFAAGGQPLKLWLNAFDCGAPSFSVQLYLRTPAGGMHTIIFSNLEAFNSGSSCLKIYDVTEKKVILPDSLGSYAFSSPANFSGIRFVLIFEQAAAHNSELQEATCSTEGRLFLPLSSITTSHYRLYKGTEVIGNFTGNLTAIDIQLPAGTYSLVNKKGLLTCSDSVFRFVIGGPAPIVAGFSSETDVSAGQEVSFLNHSQEADNYTWFFGDGNTSTEKMPVHIYMEPGQYEVLLVASKTGCPPDTASVVLSVRDVTSVGGHQKSQPEIRPTATGILISSEEQLREVIIWQADGKQIFRSESTGNTLEIMLKGNCCVYLIAVTTDSGIIRRKFIF